MGTGTTGAIAKMTGRNYIGLGRENEYIKVAQKRIDKIKIIHNDMNDMKLEVKPPKVPIDKLIKFEYLRPGQEIYNKLKEKIGILKKRIIGGSMEENVLDKVMKKSIVVMLSNAGSDKKTNKLKKKHEKKIHFIPIKYRVFGVIIQSMNIQFGNFIEEAIHQILLVNKNRKMKKR